MDGAEPAAERHASRVADRSGEERREQPEGVLGIALPAGFRTAAPSVLPECEGAGKPVLVERHPGRCGRPLMRRIMRKCNGIEPGSASDEGSRFVRVVFRLDSPYDGRR